MDSLVSLALQDARHMYTLQNPQSLSAYTASCEYMPGGNTRSVLHSSPFPMTFRSGSGTELVSLDGAKFIDFLGEYTAGIYGHDHPVIRSAIEEALSHGWNLGGNNVYEKELAKLTCERFSPTVELVRFTNSGTEANMCAIAAALAWTGKRKVLVFEGGYHGSTIGFPDSKVADMNLPHEWVVGIYNNIDATRRLVARLDHNSLAAILVEPMLGSGGAVPGDLAFMQGLREIADEQGALLIFDEVMTSRLSYRGRGHELNIRADLMTMGKWIGGGMSFGAFGGRRDVMSMFDPRSGKLRHAGTFNNNVVSMAAGCAGCKLMTEEAISSLNLHGEQMKVEIRRALDAQSVGNFDIRGKVSISGIGSILAIHFAGESEELLLALFWHHMLQNGIYLAQRGFIALNIEIKDQHVRKFVDALTSFVLKYKNVLIASH